MTHTLKNSSQRERDKSVQNVDRVYTQSMFQMSPKATHLKGIAGSDLIYYEKEWSLLREMAVEVMHHLLAQCSLYHKDIHGVHHS